MRWLMLLIGLPVAVGLSIVYEGVALREVGRSVALLRP